MNDRLCDALQDCLEHVEAGQTLDDALAQHPELVIELRPLVVAALAVRLHRPVPTPAFRARVQVALASAASEATVGQGGQNNPIANWLSAGRRPSWRAFAARLAGAGLAVALVASGVVAASANSRPGDMLYPVRRGVERIRSAAADVLVPVVRVVRPQPQATAVPAPAMPVGANNSRDRGGTRTGSATGPRHRADVGERDHPGDAGTGQTTGRRARDEATGSGSTTAPGEPTSDDDTAPVMLPSPVAAAALPTPTPTRLPQPVSPTMPGGASAPRLAPGGAAASPTPRVALVASPDEPTARPVSAGLIPATAETPWVRSGRAGLTGKVMREDGRPLARATVAAYPLSTSGEVQWWWRREARVGDDGRYRFDSLTPGRYKVRASYGSHHPIQLWYPNATKSSDAEVVTLVTGQARDGIDFRFGHIPPWPDWGRWWRR